MIYTSELLSIFMFNDPSLHSNYMSLDFELTCTSPGDHGLLKLPLGYWGNWLLLACWVFRIRIKIKCLKNQSIYDYGIVVTFNAP